MNRGLRCASGFLLTLSIAPLGAQDSASSPEPGHGAIAVAKERVTGIGGFFFRAKDPKALSGWYLTHLGVDLTPTSYDQKPWHQEAGPTAFNPFPSNTKYFDRPAQDWLINFRVRNLDAMIKQLKAAGIAVKLDQQVYPNGRFARIHDPEGNPIELWEPRMPDGKD